MTTTKKKSSVVRGRQEHGAVVDDAGNYVLDEDGNRVFHTTSSMGGITREQRVQYANEVSELQQSHTDAALARIANRDGGLGGVNQYTCPTFNPCSKVGDAQYNSQRAGGMANDFNRTYGRSNGMIMGRMPIVVSAGLTANSCDVTAPYTMRKVLPKGGYTWENETQTRNFAYTCDKNRGWKLDNMPEELGLEGYLAKRAY